MSWCCEGVEGEEKDWGNLAIGSCELLAGALLAIIPCGLTEKKHLSYSLFFILSFTSLFALDTNDRNAIDKIVEHFTHAWNDCEGMGSGDYYTQDADFVNIFGMAFSGKQEIESRHVKIHETFLFFYTSSSFASLCERFYTKKFNYARCLIKRLLAHQRTL